MKQHNSSALSAAVIRAKLILPRCVANSFAMRCWAGKASPTYVLINAESRKWGEVIKATGAKVD